MTEQSEITPIIQSDLSEQIKTHSLDDKTVLEIGERYAPFLKAISRARDIAEKTTVSSVDQIDEMVVSREERLVLTKARTSANSARQSMKADYLKRNNAIQGVYNWLELMSKPIELHFKNNEEFAVLEEQKRLAEVAVKRNLELEPFREFTPETPNIALLSDEDFGKLLQGGKLLHQKHLEDQERERIEREHNAQKAEVLRVRKDQLLPLSSFVDVDKLNLDTTEEDFQQLIGVGRDGEQKREAENERVKAQNIRLEAERKKADHQREAERLKEKAKFDKEQAERKKAQAIVQAQKDKEAQRVANEAKKANEILQGGDKAKLDNYMQLLRAVPVPVVETKEGKAVLSEVYAHLKSVVSSISYYTNEG